ncbi:putative diguanylate cyclase YedQ [Marinomonas aquimarina]|uniref:diguanylate cyclase n=1 Tax=Marinomonas aquimarina TaxID=295068 RepID=A0A1A8TEX7_9GAMM|nr:sensor domain-containing diguanylate cyclase [Marinomonas aquimarina]SBS30665.1 putative diguanylate cyclase YedQ [Marinomonas aquimarina]
MPSLLKHYRRSIALHLLLVIFGIYFLVAVLVTVIQLYKEYENTKKEFYNEIQTLPSTFGKGISDSVWTYNQELLQSILQGMYNLPIVVGVKVSSLDQKMDFQIGAVLNEQHQFEYYDSKGRPTEQTLTGLGSQALFDHEFPIYYQGPAFDQKIPLGTVTLYSNDQLVFERLKYGFILILVNSIIKTCMLWFIIYFFINKYLGKPLKEFTFKIHQQDTHSPKPIDLAINWTDKNELLVLKDSYNQMIQRVNNNQLELLKLNQELDEKVKARTQDLELAKENAELLAYSDPLTKLNNRRAFFDSGKQSLNQADTQKHSLSLIMIDLDNFKKLNDTYGHAMGDKVLIAFADMLKSSLSSTDIIGRLGGEEFAVILPNTGEEKALQIAEMLSQKASQIELIHEQSLVHFTASMGVVVNPQGNATIDSLLAQADKALYFSKRQGRNQVTAYSSVVTTT